jgi:hypothetical protein
LVQKERVNREAFRPRQLSKHPSRKHRKSAKDIMAPPSQLSIATSSVQRLVKEEASYYKELQQQEARLEKALASKDEDENAEYQLKQEAS